MLRGISDKANDFAGVTGSLSRDPLCDCVAPSYTFLSNWLSSQLKTRRSRIPVPFGSQ
jgi:hypothetical protein